MREAVRRFLYRIGDLFFWAGDRLEQYEIPLLDDTEIRTWRSSVVWESTEAEAYRIWDKVTNVACLEGGSKHRCRNFSASTLKEVSEGGALL